MMIKVALPVFIIIIIMIIFAPFAYIWAFNTLFPSLAIEYTFSTWLAVCLAHSFFHNKVSINKKD